MKGRLYIDEVDVFEAFGVTVKQYGYDNLVSLPSFKDLDTNDWEDEDGIEVDLSDPMLDSKEFSISCHSEELVRVTYLIDMLSDKAYHIFRIPEVGRSYNLRLVNCSNLDLHIVSGTFTLTLADDFPFYDYGYQEPIDIAVAQRGYEIDGIDLSAYGVCITRGSDEEIMKSPAVKENLTINTSTISGAWYDDENVYYQSKDVALNCLIRAPSKEAFWRNYLALAYDLTQPEERVFRSEKYGIEEPCFYSSLKVDKFVLFSNGSVWCEFTLTLTFTEFRCGVLEILFANEDGSLVITEDNIYAIDLK